MPPENQPHPAHSTPLRQRAEAALRHTGQDIAAMPVQDVQRLVHELQVYQIELEMQNEELRQTQHQLVAARDRYRALYDAAPIGYLTLDHNDGILEANLPAAQLLGADLSQLRHAKLSDFVLPDSQDTLYLHRRQAMATRTLHTCTLHLQRQDGTTFWCRLDSVMTPEEPGQPRQWRTALSDLTAEQQAAEVLQQRDWLEVTLASIGDAVLTTDTSGTITFLNRVAEALTGWSAQEARGRAIDDVFCLIHAHTRERLSSPVSQALYETSPPARLPETLLMTRTGSAIPITHSVAPIRSGSGTPHGVVVVFHDLTMRRQLEAQLREAHKMEALGVLAGGVAHDFNNILAGMLGFTELAQRVMVETHPAWPHLHTVLVAGQRAKELIQQILIFSRRNVPHREPLRLSPLIEETLRLLRATVPSTIELRTSLMTTADTVMANPTQLQQVLMNLAGNAVYAMQETGGVCEVQLEEIEITPADMTIPAALPSGPYLRLTVRDTGAGMSAEVLDRIFEPFYTTKGPHEGTGMGLSVAYGIITSHEGAITVASTSGVGTTFTIYLPQIAASPPVPVDSAAPLPKGKARVLWVDDEAMLVELGQIMLTNLGYIPTAYTSAAEALAAFQAAPQSFDLVITDHIMPDMLGETLIGALRHIRPDIPIILCTGYSPFITTERGKALEIDALLVKPVEMKTFAHTIQHVLTRQADRERP